MKKLIIMVLFIMMISFTTTKAETQIKKVDINAGGGIENVEEKNIDTMDEKDVENLYEYMRNIKLDHEVSNDLNVKSYISNYIKTGKGNLNYREVLKGLLSYTFKEVISSSKFLVMVIVIALITALLKNIQDAFTNDNITNIAYFACYSILIMILSKSFLISINLAKGTIKELTDFMAALIPVLMLLLTSVGGVAQVATMDPITLIAINVIPRFYVDFIIPFILMGFVLQFINSLSEDYKITKLAKLSNQIVLWVQGIIMTIFIGIITIRGATSSTLDAVTAKTAKFAVDNFVPIVGKALSDAVATVAGYSLLLKNAVSVLGLVIIIFIIITPILKLFIMAMLYKITAAFIEPISDKRIIECVSSIGDSIILIMSCVICISVMFFIMIAIIASSGKAIIGV
ncbi:stage III sporulation protein AE [Clostridium algidicarnis]|uniref:stage III sporulation protein AE n=1 Tax=Clostridium algidicarnis TaxID=37659 RepID=UPI001C0AF5F0|nr:stage III sporulation protein AE [Clostridium algidicarnis]MBU3226980.1 stage III sporulation protein AE [Clostridium algidicarnis]MBU3250109.1 stage III sporulation protein AE [Clostridium algidicarnis]